MKIKRVLFNTVILAAVVMSRSECTLRNATSITHTTRTPHEVIIKRYQFLKAFVGNSLNTTPSRVSDSKLKAEYKIRNSS